MDTCSCCGQDPEAVELRLTDDGELICDLGVFTHPTPVEDDGTVTVGPLILLSKEFIQTILFDPPTRMYGCDWTGTNDGRAVYISAAAPNGKWTWRVVPTVWWDHLEPHDIWLGKWPD